jgi:DNA modification methylase
MDKDRNPTEKGKNNFVDQMKSFIDEFKEKFDGVIGEKILISYNSEDFYDLSELKNTLDSNFEYLSVYILLKTKILGEELNNIFLSMSDYGFYADYPNDEEKIITQGYDKGEYDTGYFAANTGNWDLDPEGYISDKNNPMSLSLKKYNEVMKTLAE